MITTAADLTLARALRHIETASAMTEAGPWTTLEGSRPIERLPDHSEGAAFARSSRAQDLLRDVDALEAALLPHDVATTIGVVRATAERWAREGGWYWHVFDPNKVGFFALFAPTAYAGGFNINGMRATFQGFAFAGAGDVDRYLGLVADLARVIRQFAERTRGQAERGIRMPGVQLDQALRLVKGLKASAGAMLTVAPERLAQVAAGTGERIARRIAADIPAEFDALLAVLTDPDYRARAPDAVGMSQYKGGSDIYSELVKFHLTLDLTPEAVHAAGHARMAAIHDQMRALFAEIGFTGNAAAYIANVRADPAWRADGADAIGRVFRRYIDRIAPCLDRYFAFAPKAPHDVAPLADALAASMSFGYYDPPSAVQLAGRYLFNARNLSQNALAGVATLTYHELVPGHHLHVASQRENTDLPPIRRSAFFNAFNEGWAEYAAALAGEMGMYQAPEERFGRMMMDSFLTSRLVVDTGMNALGWSLERARDYMRGHSFMPEAEVCSETIRYSADTPGQSLAYKLGDTFLLDLREKMRATLGARFDIRDFHDAVLKPGALPLPLVAANVQSETARLLATA